MDAITRLAEHYGVGLIFLNVLLEQLGLPIPAVPTLIAAGALVADGRLSGYAVLAVAVLASVIADSTWYLAGRRYGNGIMKTLCRVSLSPDSCVRQAEVRFERWGASLLLFSKFIPMAALIAPPLAGAMRIRWPIFLLFSTCAAIAWGSAGIGAGLLFHHQVEYVLGTLEDMGRWGLIVIGVILALYIALRYIQRRRFFRMLRMARITADELHDMIEGGTNPIVIDVRSHASRSLDGRRIPGALLVDMAAPLSVLPEPPRDRDVVVYCTCPNEASAARVAKALMLRGFTRVRPLLGGLDAWVEAGYAVDRVSVIGTVQETEDKPRTDAIPRIDAEV